MVRIKLYVLMKSGLGSYMGHLGSETRSQGQIKGKPCEDNRGHIFMKFGQNVCFDEIWDEIVYGSSGVKKLGHRVKS